MEKGEEEEKEKGYENKEKKENASVLIWDKFFGIFCWISSPLTAFSKPIFFF